MFAPPVLQEEMAKQNAFSVPSAPTKTAATERTSPRAERAIEQSAIRAGAEAINSTTA
jgi:hypothetical protein